MLIDSHVNLHAPQFDDDREAVIGRARAAGVGLMVTICDKISSFDAVEAIAEAHDDVWMTVGTHPHEAKENRQLAPNTLCDLAARPKVVGIGETGLDFHYDLSPRDIQAAVFRAHIEAARRSGLPLIVHTREADAAMGEILEEEHAKAPFRILMHCYTSGRRTRPARGGAGGLVLGLRHRHLQGRRGGARRHRRHAGRPHHRRDRLPLPGPVPMRGRRNEPAFLPHILAKLAEIRGWAPAEAEARTEDAFFALFDRIPSAMSGALEVTILGCGSSGGVPRADGNWGACDPANPRNRRSRCSLLVRRSSRGGAGSPDQRGGGRRAGISPAGRRRGHQAPRRPVAHP